MRMNGVLIAVLALSFFLSACKPERGEIDAKLARACEAAFRVLMEPDDQVEIKETSFDSGTGMMNVPLRIVNFSVLYTHAHGVTVERKITCKFKEQEHLLGIALEFQSLQLDRDQYGNFDGMLQGDIMGLQKINDAMEKHLY